MSVERLVSENAPSLSGGCANTSYVGLAISGHVASDEISHYLQKLMHLFFS